MKIAVCDDDKLFIDSVCDFLHRWAEQNDLEIQLFCFSNGDGLINTYRTGERMDLILLDVLMPFLNGLDTAKELRDIDAAVPIIFLTSSKEFAIESYDVKAFHYLLKPLNAEKLSAVMDDFLRTSAAPKKMFAASTNDGFIQLVVSDVEYIEAQNRHVFFHMTDGRTIAGNDALYKCSEVFDEENGFLSCHRSYIINLGRIQQFDRSRLITTRHAMIPISRNRYEKLKDAYLHRFFAQKGAAH